MNLPLETMAQMREFYHHIDRTPHHQNSVATMKRGLLRVDAAVLRSISTLDNTEAHPPVNEWPVWQIVYHMYSHSNTSISTQFERDTMVMSTRQHQVLPREGMKSQDASLRSTSFFFHKRFQSFPNPAESNSRAPYLYWHLLGMYSINIPYLNELLSSTPRRPFAATC